MAVRSPQDLFVHAMSDIYDAEKRILQILPTLASESNNLEAKNAYQDHERETRQQVSNLEQCFQLLGVEPMPTACLAIAGLKQEHDSFRKENPPDDLLTMYDLGGAAKTEHYEIASYRGLIDQANMMGQQRCAQLLQQNLQQEENMAHRVEMIARQVGQQTIGQMGHRP